MTRPSTPPILSELRSASSPASQVAALRALKNEVIGHEQKKEMWIGLGVLAPISRILNTHRVNGKKRHRDVNGSRSHSKQRGGRPDEEEARLQAIIIVGSLAHGGPAYIPPICAGLVISPLLALLSPIESSPQLILAALKTLNAVADSLALANLTHITGDDGLLSLLYSEQHLSTITNILLQTSPSLVTQQQIALTAALISKTYSEERHGAMLAQAGVLEALAMRLAAFVVATGCSINSNSGSGSNGEIPPASSRSKMAPILEAIAAIILHSEARALQFLSAPAFASVFQKANGWGQDAANAFNNRQAPANVLENLIPLQSNPHSRSSLAPQSNFPPLGALGATGKQSQISRSFSSAVEIAQSQMLTYTGEEDESPLILWLVHIARAENEVTGLIAAWVIAILHQHRLTKRGREATFATLLVPSLVGMLDKDLKISRETLSPYELNATMSPEKFIKERAPLVLAKLAQNRQEVQKAAADAGAIKKLSQLLKESYDEMPVDSSSSLWSPEPLDDAQAETREESSKLGPTGVSATTHHILQLRESVLVALAAIASEKDEYRKAVIDNGVIPFVIRTMKPEEANISSVPQASTPIQTEMTSKDRKAFPGNGREAIIAACGTIKALSRSVGTLRTSLMDAGLAAPLFVLLKCQDIELQIQATAVVVNLVLSFSPMREAIIEAGILKVLCEHAHSMNTNLRLNSVWALKHLVFDSSSDLKRTVLDELGPGWLKQIVNNDVEGLYPTSNKMGDREEGNATPIRMSTPNAAGEQVDLLNAVEEDSRESSQAVEEDGEEDLRMIDSIGALSREKQLASSFLQGNGRCPTSDNTGRIERHSSSQTLTDESAIQKQGLDLIRNLMSGPGAADMIDLVFRELGQDKLFEMLAAKLRPRVYNAFNRERRSSEGVKQVQPQTEIIISASI
ncbi:armadillo repeat-containing protein 8, partial [Lecanoromycetidae sp. Uapishka_2]